MIVDCYKFSDDFEELYVTVAGDAYNQNFVVKATKKGLLSIHKGPVNEWEVQVKRMYNYMGSWLTKQPYYGPGFGRLRPDKDKDLIEAVKQCILIYLEDEVDMEVKERPQMVQRRTVKEFFDSFPSYPPDE